MYIYTNDADRNDPHKLPNVGVFEVTATEVAEADEDLVRQYLKRPEFRLANMNSRIREKMLDAMVEENGITGGWVWHYCTPGCLPDSAWYGPFATPKEAADDAIAQTEVD